MAFPFGLSLEQASSETTARFKAGLFSGKTMADLTGGMGVDTFFFSRQFESVVYVEQNAVLLEATRRNFNRLGVRNTEFEHQTAEDFLAHTSNTFDLIYLDPARRNEHKGKVFQLADCTPDVLKIKDLLLEKSPRVLLKAAPLLDLKLAAAQLGQVTHIWVVAAAGDCREVLYLLERNPMPTERIPITAVSLESKALELEDVEPTSTFEFSWEEEQQAAPPYSAPLQFLYEPNPAILKAGAFRSFAHRFGLAKLHANTHLYTSMAHLPEAPARIFAIEQVCKYDRKAVLPYVPTGKANIACRNFPDNPAQVRSKLGLVDGGDHYLFAATDVEGKKVVMVCKKA